MLSFVNAIVALLYCNYIMHDLHHILLDYCNYVMMQSWLWQMVHTRATDDDVLDISRDSPRVNVGVDSLLVAMHRRHHRIRQSSWSSCWLRRISS
jgi:hypothetical protein